MEVAAGVFAWYHLVSHYELGAAFKHAGITNKLDGSENRRVTISLPSGERVYPSYGGKSVEDVETRVQAGFGVSISGAGPEIVVDPWKDEKALNDELEPSSEREQNFSKLIVRTEPEDRKRVFLTEKQKQELADAVEAAGGAGKKKSSQGKRNAEDEASMSEQEESETEGSDSESDTAEARGAFDLVALSQAAEEQLDAVGPLTVVSSAPKRLDETTLGQRLIAFCFATGWDIGRVERVFDPPKKVNHQLYHVDVLYPEHGGTRYHWLRPELYGSGEGEDAPLASWVLLEEKKHQSTTAAKSDRKTGVRHKRKVGAQKVGTGAAQAKRKR